MANNWWRRIRNKLSNSTSTSTTSTMPSSSTTSSSSTKRKISRGRSRGRSGYTMHSADRTHAYDDDDDYEPNPFSDVGGLLSNLPALSSSTISSAADNPGIQEGEGGGSHILPSSLAQCPLATSSLPLPSLPQPPPPAASARGDEKKPIIDEEYSSLSLAQAHAHAHAHADAGLSTANDESYGNGIGGNGTVNGGGLIGQCGSRLRPMRLALRRNS